MLALRSLPHAVEPIDLTNVVPGGSLGSRSILQSFTRFYMWLPAHKVNLDDNF